MFIGFIQNVWDPLSLKQTTKLINLLKDLHETYPSVNSKSKQLQVLHFILLTSFSFLIIMIARIMLTFLSFIFRHV